MKTLRYQNKKKTRVETRVETHPTPLSADGGYTACGAWAKERITRRVQRGWTPAHIVCATNALRMKLTPDMTVLVVPRGEPLGPADVSGVETRPARATIL
jgi:hypothetical protein